MCRLVLLGDVRFFSQWQVNGGDGDIGRGGLHRGIHPIEPLGSGLPAFLVTEREGAVYALQEGGTEAGTQVGVQGERGAAVFIAQSVEASRRVLAGEQAVTGGAESVDVNPRPLGTVGLQLFERGIPGAFEHRGTAVAEQGACCAEVDNHGSAGTLKQNIVRFDIAVQ